VDLFDDLVKESEGEHLGDLIDVVEGQALEVMILDLEDVLLILTAEDDVGDPGALSREDLLLDTSDRKDLAPQGDLPCHRQMSTHLASGDGRHEGGDHRDPCTGSILRNSPFGYVDMDLLILELLQIDTELGSVGTDIAEGDRCRLLHHITEATGEDELTVLSWLKATLDEEDLSTNARPGKTHDDTWVLVTLVLIP